VVQLVVLERLMRMEVRSVQVPRWLAPLLLLLALALIPLALMVAVGFAALTIGATVVRAVLPSSSRSPVIQSRSVESSIQPHSAIDAEYEIKDEK